MHHTGITKPHTLVLSVPMFPPYLPKYIPTKNYLSTETYPSTNKLLLPTEIIEVL